MSRPPHSGSITSACLVMPRARCWGAAGSGPLPLAGFFFMAVGFGGEGWIRIGLSSLGAASKLSKATQGDGAGVSSQRSLQGGRGWTQSAPTIPSFQPAELRGDIVVPVWRSPSPDPNADVPRFWL